MDQSWLLQFTTLLSVIAIDLTLAVDNAVVMSMAASRLPRDLQKNAILIGVIAATFFRIVFSLFAVQMLAVVGLTLAGGILLLWVAWKLWRDLRNPKNHANHAHAKVNSKLQAVWQIVIADISMSLDNTLAVAGTARHHLWIMIVGLGFSVLFMAIAAHLLAGLLQKYRWISYVGLVIVVYVAGSMIWDGTHEVLSALQ